MNMECWLLVWKIGIDEKRSMSNMSLVEIDFYSKIYFIAIKQKENKY